MKKSLLLIILTVTINVAFSQFDTTRTFYDRFGTEYFIDELVIRTSSSKTGTYEYATVSDHFVLTFDNDNSEFTQDVRDVIVQVFEDLEVLITPVSCGGNIPKVNYLFLAPPTGPQGDPLPNGTAGAAVGSSFYSQSQQACCDPSVENSGIIESEVWRAFNTGINDPIIYDAYIKLNFHSTDFTFNTDLLTLTDPLDEVDLYTTVLHEIMHTLGFASLYGSKRL